MTHVVVTEEAGSRADLRALESVAHHVCRQLRLHPDTEVGITLVDEARMTDLHVEWMHEPGATDVLSFPMDELRPPEADEQAEPGHLGDIVLCPDFAARQAAARGRTLDEELQFLVVHGMLHLLGHDHATQEEYDEMFALQGDLLDQWQVNR